MPPAKAIEELPDVVVAFLLGARIHNNYKGGDGIGVLVDGGEKWHLAKADFDMAQTIAKKLHDTLDLHQLANAWRLFDVRRHAVREVRDALDLREGKPREKAVAMLKDKGGSGWWRMVIPARYMQKDGWRFDCTAAQVKFDHLLEYDTIFVQRIHDWESYYTLERLKAAGKRIVYDIDDDLFNITPDNPAYNTITRDDQLAAAQCMKLADLVTTTTAELQRRLTGVMDGVAPLVIPNAWDVDDNWTPTFKTGSPDGKRRIFWSGGASHGADWEVCFEAVHRVMQDCDDVRLVIAGFLPPCIENNARLDPFAGRVEYVGFRHPETYYNLIHHVRAEVALCPLRSTGFNAAKSPIKYLEYSSIGIPTVASNWLPYSAVIQGDAKGKLASTTEEWEEAIRFYLDNTVVGHKTVAVSRKNC